ncbi:MAG: WbqC family protein [Pseudomonadota bacterium]|nr:WbqC family protein [Pseudomonadota bacterium]
MTTLAVMQPTYMPWLGYFDLMDQADHFVFLDDVQLARQSWQTRNRVRGPSGDALMLSIPVRHTGALDATLAETEIDDDKPWRKKHARTVEQAYARAPHGKAASILWQQILASPQTRLAGFNAAAIKHIAAAAGLPVQTSHSSEYQLPDDRVDRLIALCHATGCDTYLSTPGAMDYMQADGAFDRFHAHGLKVIFQSYTHPQYDQGGPDFLSHLGCVDAIAHLGIDAVLPLLRSGRQPSRLPEARKAS